MDCNPVQGWFVKCDRRDVRLKVPPRRSRRINVDHFSIEENRGVREIAVDLSEPLVIEHAASYRLVCEWIQVTVVGLVQDGTSYNGRIAKVWS